MGCRIKSLTPTEAEIQSQIVEGLTLIGYLVLVTSRRYRPCPRCGVIDHRGDGASRGLPDLLVRHPRWPALTWVGLEVKKPGGRVSPEQQALAQAGAIAVVRSLEDAVAVLRALDV